MIDLSREKIDANCPNCNARISTTLDKVSRNAVINCRSCGERIQLKDQGGATRKAIRDIKKASDDLEKAFKKLGGRR